MPYYEFFWLDETIEHLAEHGVEPVEFEEVVSAPDTIGESRSSGRPCCWGETSDGRYLFCVFEKLDELTILPITAFESRRRGE
jgi:hypothetical protein